MKLSISLPDDDVEFLDIFAGRSGCNSRSAVVHAAITMLRSAELVGEYEVAFTEWADSPDAALWDSATGDGIAS